jgi:hypothetical protein
MTATLTLSEDDIAQHVGSVETLKRGIVYAKSGAVLELELRDSTVRARIGGGAAEPYRAWATFAVGHRSVSVAFCACADGGQGQCKHVAAMLYALGRQLHVDPTLLKRMAVRSSEQHPTAAAESSAKAKTPTKRVLPRMPAKSAASPLAAAAAAEAPPVVAIECDQSQDVEIQIRGERRAGGAADLPPPGPVVRPANWYNRALSDPVPSSQLSSTESVPAAAKHEPSYTTLESFNAMQIEIKQLQVILRWTRIAYQARVRRLKERCAALERDSALSRAQLPRQVSSGYDVDDDQSGDETTAAANPIHRDTAPPPPPPPEAKRKAPAASSAAAAAAAAASAKQRRVTRAAAANVRPEYRAWDDEDGDEW